MAGKEAGERFWAHALGVYGQEAAREAFLRLQDRDGADVPMLLWCLWCGAQGVVLPHAAMQEAVTFSCAWRGGIVDPLRSLRREMKGGVEGLPADLCETARGKVAAAEQDIERLQMLHLAELSPESGDAAPGEAMRTNILLYADCAGLALSEADCSAVLSCAGA